MIGLSILAKSAKCCLVVCQIDTFIFAIYEVRFLLWQKLTFMIWKPCTFKFFECIYKLDLFLLL